MRVEGNASNSNQQENSPLVPVLTTNEGEVFTPGDHSPITPEREKQFSTALKVALFIIPIITTAVGAALGFFVGGTVGVGHGNVIGAGIGGTLGFAGGVSFSLLVREEAKEGDADIRAVGRAFKALGTAALGTVRAMLLVVRACRQH